GLYATYGDWLLTIAAYNCGTGTIAKAIKKAGSKNFWSMQSYLPAETRGHVKRYIATQYYFEGCASITCLTKAEMAAYQKSLEGFSGIYDSVALVK
ncbi:MAG: lytic transglycosylase, partial [Chitinophagaceae bacterium]